MALEFRLSPMPVVNAPDFDQSREVLALFIEWVGYFLRQMDEYRDYREPDDVPYFDPELTGRYHAAWEEFSGQGHIEHVAGYLRDPDDIEALRSALFEHGLVGVQLSSKLAISNYYTGLMRGVINRRARGLLSRLLATIDSILKSILGALPGGGAIEELKEMLENIRFVEDDADFD